MTEKELFQEIASYEVFLRMQQEIKEEPDVDEDGAFIMQPGESDDEGNWYWQKDDKGQWHLTGFNQERFDIYINNSLRHYEEDLRKKYHLGTKAKWH